MTTTHTPTAPDHTPARYRAGWCEYAAAALVPAGLLFLTVMLLLGYGAPDSRAALGLSTPVATVATVHHSATAADVPTDEDSPRWDCTRQGNHTCGYGTPGGPDVSDVGVLRVVCPVGGVPVDLPFVQLTGSDVESIARTIGCRYPRA